MLNNKEQEILKAYYLLNNKEDKLTKVEEVVEGLLIQKKRETIILKFIIHKFQLKFNQFTFHLFLI